jgi:enterobacterial common antigen flippase
LLSKKRAVQSMASSNQPLASVLGPSAAPCPESVRPRKHTYGQILKSSAVIGGSSVVKIGLGIVRTKALAVLLGPAGVGLLGLYGTIADLAQTIAGVGINTSGVRQIAEAVGTGDNQCISRTVTTLRRVALLLGALGALLLVVFCRPVGRLSFGDDQHAGAVALLALAVFFGAVSGGQIALVQGMRRIADLALTNLWGALYGTVFSIGVVYFFAWRGDSNSGVVPALVCVAAMGIVTSWWYSRKIKVDRVAMRLGDVAAEVSALLKLGFVFMASALLATGAAYLVRIIVMRKMGEDAAGFYQSAWGLGGMYVGIILQAMGADFFPRLTAAAKDNEECNRLVNEQAEVSLLLAGPGVLATLTLAPMVIHLFYSAKFEPAVDVLRWICLGMMLRVASWPMGYILLAKGARQPFFWSELASSLVQVALVWFGVLGFGLTGTGMAFAAGYAFYWCLIYAIVRLVSGFRWSTPNKHVGLFYGLLMSAVFVGRYFLPQPLVIAGGLLATLLTGIYAIRRVCRLVPLDRLPRPVKWTFALLRLMPPDPGQPDRR